MQRSLGLDVEWLEAQEAEKLNPQMAAGICLGGSYASGDGYIDPPRNVLAYALVLSRSGVEVREGVGFVGLKTSAGRVTGIKTTAGIINTERVVLTGGPDLAAVGRLAGISIPAGGARHQVAVTTQCPELSPESDPMVFDVGAGLYWRPEDGGLLFGMSNPEELPGVAHSVDWGYLEHMRERLGHVVPGTRGLALRRVWAATIDFTPDHLPIIGEASGGAGAGGAGTVRGAVIASAGGHGMMWGPAVARAAADLSLHGSTNLVDVADLGLDRFDEHGRSRLTPDPIALPFPERTSARSAEG
jgi:sarcosine oxidase subunit beta